MKNIGLLLVSIMSFFIILSCLFYNSLLIDMEKIKDYVTDSNLILKDVVEDKVDSREGEYIHKLLNIKTGIENTNTTFLLDKYKVVKISSIELLIEAISEDNKEDKEEYMDMVFNSNDESQNEIDLLMDKNILEVTNMYFKTYIKLQ